MGHVAVMALDVALFRDYPGLVLPPHHGGVLPLAALPICWGGGGWGSPREGGRLGERYFRQPLYLHIYIVT